ncbi:MAG: Fic family protein [Thiomicrospira sp.]|jgi:hypothetical protein|nr:Fic family protein [Thiomicrospira sp.]
MKISIPVEAAQLAGYSALIQDYDLYVPMPDRLFAIGRKHQVAEINAWVLLTPRHAPPNSLLGHLTFALKYEGIHLWLLKALFQKIPPDIMQQTIQLEPTGAYSRRVWFLYEWLLQQRLDLSDATLGGYVDLVSERLQYAGRVEKSPRHRVNNNLPGTQDFCPLIRKTPKLERWLQANWQGQALDVVGNCHPDVLARAASFLLLADSKASFTIEGEQPPQSRVARWGRVIAMAGKQPLSLAELERLQQLVLSDRLFIQLGLRQAGGFIGLHDRYTGAPLPEHISAKADDLPSLIQGLFETYARLKQTDFPPVLLATMMAFGFVFIHPFEDGNGRLHRYLIHHVLAETGFVPKGLVFPVSSVILQQIETYRRVLQAYSLPRLDCIEWQVSPQNNVVVTNQTADLYRYFDATMQAEFLADCIATTISELLPQEVDYLNKYDAFVARVNEQLDWPQKMTDLLVRFLSQNQGRLSACARAKEFVGLTDGEVAALEQVYQAIFM